MARKKRCSDPPIEEEPEIQLYRYSSAAVTKEIEDKYNSTMEGLPKAPGGGRNLKNYYRFKRGNVDVVVTPNIRYPKITNGRMDCQWVGPPMSSSENYNDVRMMWRPGVVDGFHSGVYLPVGINHEFSFEVELVDRSGWIGASSSRLIFELWNRPGHTPEYGVFLSKDTWTIRHQMSVNYPYDADKNMKDDYPHTGPGLYKINVEYKHNPDGDGVSNTWINNNLVSQVSGSVGKKLAYFNGKPVGPIAFIGFYNYGRYNYPGAGAELFFDNIVISKPA